MSRSARRIRLRAKLYASQEECCFYCEGRMRLLEHPDTTFQPADMVTLEHVQQAAEGGTYEEDNVKGACAGCNVARPNGMPSDDYMQLRRDLIKVWPACSHLPAKLRPYVQSRGPQDIYHIAHQGKEAAA